MNLLLDTCTFIWITQGSGKLSSTVVDIFVSPENSVYLSAVSAWEISIKFSLGKLNLPYIPEKFIPRERQRHMITKLPLRENDIFALAKLPDIHKDPFDRMLICQAIENGLTILTPDEQIHRYPVKTLW
jgi:PIN domain nuclease of toxin-antitoxin system